jgi:hypothetical protein
MINVLPSNDLKDHDESTACECRPRVEMINGEMLVIHNAYDNREVVEQANEILKQSSNSN